MLRGRRPMLFVELPSGSARFCALVVLFAGWCSTGCQRAPEAQAAERTPLSVQVLAAAPHPMERSISAQGTLAALDRATVSIKATGRLKLLSVDVGSPVRVGEVLAQVEPRDYELRVQQAAALLAQARARLGLPLEGDNDAIDLEATSIVREAKTLHDEAVRALERIRRLQAERIASQSELERAEAEQQVTFSRYRDALQEARERLAVLAQRRAEFDLARQQVTDTSLRAPFDGVVQARLANVGEFLASGSPVLSLVRVDPLRARLEVSERRAPLIQVGQTVRLRFDALSNVYSAAIARVSPALDERNRVLVVEAELRNPGELRPGAFARAEIIVESARPALAVPEDCVVAFAGTERLFVVSTNRAVERRIQTGRRQDGWIEILQGLSVGEPVIRKPGGMAPGDPVRPATGSALTNSPALTQTH